MASSHIRSCLRTAAAVLVAVWLSGCSSSTEDGEVVGTSSSTTAATTTVPLPVDELFVDPDGTYQLRVPSTWQANHGLVVAEVELWLVEEPTAGGAPNVNILTQQAPGLTLSEYRDASVGNAPAAGADFEVLSSELIDGANGQPLALMEYRAGEQQYLGVFGMTDAGQAIVATLTAPADRYDELKAAVLPALLTLEPLPGA
ncbi:MAG: hypothetical protein R2710_03420 [Acidimicrobiales bacterium]